ncbi:hypothetical protein AXG93_829s1140 [Marchantia polymorpha subsp. ruderalis]|uniref:Uncharacterized protein n=1 Tax=Marchantia polymorpha subsp. ruderalis TaxID=1480154 RepID=A0A176W381_MARPO|nr:hypothetical protein AXG93_829s1140 [Marchantia polymorpha subsp. ruderalis]
MPQLSNLELSKTRFADSPQPHPTNKSGTGIGTNSSDYIGEAGDDGGGDGYRNKLTSCIPPTTTRGDLVGCTVPKSDLDDHADARPARKSAPIRLGRMAAIHLAKRRG